jgi:four helix bundle protein
MWQRAVDLAVLTHLIVEQFPIASRIAYGSQLRRSAVSVAANIAEGAGRRHRRELVQFLAIARGSLAELQTHRVIIGRLNLAPKEQLNNMDETIDHVARMLTKSINTLSR